MRRRRRDSPSAEVLKKLAYSREFRDNMYSEEGVVLADALAEYGYKKLSRELSKNLKLALKAREVIHFPADMDQQEYDRIQKQRRAESKKIDRNHQRLKGQIFDAIDEIAEKSTRKMMWYVDIYSPRRFRGSQEPIVYPVEVLGQLGKDTVGGQRFRVVGLAGKFRGKAIEANSHELYETKPKEYELARGTSHFLKR